MISIIAFYLFATLTIASAIAVIFARNPVHSVLWLILAFFNSAGLMLLLGAEFIAMLVVIVYVGAVAVLFLFVVMMLDIDFAELRAGFMKHMPFGILMGGIALSSARLPFFQFLLMSGHPAWHSLFMVLVVGVNVLGNALMIPALGIVGAALGTALSFLASIVLLRLCSRLALGVGI